MSLALGVLVLLVMGVVGLGVWYALLKMRAVLVRMHRRPSDPKDSTENFRRRLLWGMWYLAVYLSVGSFIILAASAYEYFATLARNAIDSKMYARQAIGDEYDVAELEPNLFFAVNDELTVSGVAPLPGEVFLIHATLKDKRRAASGCTPGYAARLVNQTTINLRGVQITKSDPTIEAGWLSYQPKRGKRWFVCGIRWTWAAVIASSGKVAASVSLVLRNGKALEYEARPLHFAAPYQENPEALFGFLSSIGVALISLSGVLLSGWIGARKANGNHGS